jgi:hypothetical protein
VIHDIGILLQAKLRTAGFGSAVVIDGPETSESASWGRERIVIERFGDERPSNVRSQRRNPEHVTVRPIPAKISVYAQSTKPGALPWEHANRADKIVDLVLIALNDIAATNTPYNVWAWTGGEFVSPPDLEKSARKGGAVFELRVTFERAVMRKTFAGAIEPEVELDGGVDGVGIDTTRRVGVNGSESFENF